MSLNEISWINCIISNCNFIKKETLAWVFSCGFCEISKNTFFTEHLWTTASVSISFSLWKWDMEIHAFLKTILVFLLKLKEHYRTAFFESSLSDVWSKLITSFFLLINPLSGNPTKWSNTLKQFVGNLLANCLSVFDHFVVLALKGLTL